jgi:hypothetical protein
VIFAVASGVEFEFGLEIAVEIGAVLMMAFVIAASVAGE